MPLCPSFVPSGERCLICACDSSESSEPAAPKQRRKKKPRTEETRMRSEDGPTPGWMDRVGWTGLDGPGWMDRVGWVGWTGLDGPGWMDLVGWAGLDGPLDRCCSKVGVASAITWSSLERAHFNVERFSSDTHSACTSAKIVSSDVE